MNRLQRKPDLEALGLKMGLKPTRYKLKRELIAAIQQNIRYTRYLHSYNDSDPITLMGLHTIDDDFYVEWSQHGLVFGADIRSIQNMFAHHMYTMPFSLDMQEGCDYDMRLVDELRIRLGKLETRIENEKCDIGWTNWVMFKLDTLCGNDSGYIYGKVNDLLIKQTNPKHVKKLLVKSMMSIYSQLILSDEPNTEWITDTYYQIVAYPFKNTRKTDLSSNTVLKFAIELCERFENTIGVKAHQIIFMIFNDV
jgi:hypothetical protein